MAQIGDKGSIRCEVRGFSRHKAEHGPIRAIVVEAFGHLIAVMETEFNPDAPATEPVEAEKFPPLDP
jgi:hypothetical protein